MGLWGSGPGASRGGLFLTAALPQPPPRAPGRSSPVALGVSSDKTWDTPGLPGPAPEVRGRGLQGLRLSPPDCP